MKSKTWLLGGAAVVAILVGGYALAQSHARGGFEGMDRMNGQMHGSRMHGMMSQNGGRQGGMSDHSGHDQRGNGPPAQQGNAGPDGRDNFGPALLESRKAEIGIKPEQETVWIRYVTTVKTAAEANKSRRDALDDAALQKMTPGERFAFVSARREQSQKQLADLDTAAKELLATLDDGQKAKVRNLPGLGESGSRSAMSGGLQTNSQQGNVNGERHRH